MSVLREKRYFGTDGIRGKVGDEPITAEFILKLGWAAGRVLAQQEGPGKVVIGKDTRISGYLFESALQAGLSSAGVDICLLGPMPTPGIAYLTRTLHAQAGIVISASHNPYYDNGIKFFSHNGAKLPDDIEFAIEEEIQKPMRTVDSSKLGKAERIVDAAGRYIEFCKSTIPLAMEFDGLKIVLDCAHGANYQVSPSVFKELRADVVTLGVTPDGLNINQKCGSTHPESLQKAVLDNNAHVGIALDGDGDRVVMVDEKGELLDGDELLYIIACSQKQRGVFGGAVVGTLMTNLGLERALQRHDIELKRAKVGDRYVLELLKANGWKLGGESSGHIICLDKTTTGDGTISALQVLATMIERGQTLSELRAGMTKYPQTLINVRTENKFDVTSVVAVQSAVAEEEKSLGEEGRVLLRASGTEPVIRVMVEGADASIVESSAERLADVVRQAYAHQFK